MKWLEFFDQVPSDYYRVSLAIINRLQADVPMGLTSQELSRASGMSVIVVEESIKWFKIKPEGHPFLYLVKKEKHYNLRLNKYYVGVLPSVPFTYDDTDQTRIKMLERELLTQHQTVRYTDVSGVAEATSPADAEVIQEIEYTLGRAITATEAFFIAKLLADYGPKRFLRAFRAQRKAKAPLRVTYIILTKGASGSSFGKEPSKTTNYAEL